LRTESSLTLFSALLESSGISETNSSTSPTQDDITADITVDSSRALGAAVGGVSSGQTYTVKPGDTLSKTSKELYGDSNEYMSIFYANRDKLTDPDKIQVGQQLTIPAKS
jgi:nucleoid-associated protein YgaU